MVESKIKDILGKFPKKVSLEPKIIERKDCGTYFREKVEYNTEKGERVKAYILIPKRRNGKTPAIFCHHQNAFQWELGKSEVCGISGDPEQAYAKELAERGFITFAPDAIAFEERQQNTSFAKKYPFVANFSELSNRLVIGETLLAKILHDIFVGIDYLTIRKEVDENKIGFIGHSYGGKMALWAPAFDKRIKASVSNCGCVLFKDYKKVGLPIEFTVPNMFNQIEIYGVVRQIEPNSLFLSGKSNDPLSSGMNVTYMKSKKYFKKGTLNFKMHPGKEHVFSKEMRKEAYNFLDSKLRNS